MSSPPEHADRELTLALERSDARYRFLTETIPVQVWTSRPDGNLDYVSEQTASALGLTPAALLVEGWQNVVHPDDLARAVERWVHSLQTGETYEVEFRLKLASGQYAWHLARAVPQREANGAIVGWVGTNTNIEDQRAQQRKVQALLDNVADNAATLATTLSSIGDGVIATDTQGRITFVNPVAAALTGWSNVEAVGKALDDVFRIIAEGSRETVESPAMKVLREGETVQLDNHTVLLRRDGTELSIEDSAAPIRDAAGTLSGVVLVFRDASEKRRIEEERRSLLAQSQRATREAEAARAELEGLFMQAPAPICILRGAEHVFAFANPAYLELVAGRNLVGLSVREALPELEGQGFYELLDGVYRTGERFVGENAPIKLQRGAESVDRFLTFVYDAFRDIDDNIVGVLVMAFDVTDNELARQSAQATLATTEAARRDAEAASRTKDEFLATASHELRTPLSAILGWARMLRGESLDAASFVRGLEVIERNAQVQVQLIEDMLDGSRIISGKLHLEIRSLDFAIVVQAAVDAVRPAAAARNIGIEVALGANERLRGDPDRLQQVVWNLLNNAIKFTPKGGHVHVALGRSGTHIELIVRDSGQGIEGDFLPHVFDRFRQADGTSTRRHGGLGLGLALVRHLVEAHGGSVSAESEGAGKGATFTVLLPVLAVYPDAAPMDGLRPTPVAGSSPNASRGSLSGLTVLVVDDENDVRDLVATLLEMHGAVVKTAASVEQAMTILEEMTPSILISDIGMPEADGYSLLRRVRALEGPSGRVPAIALTAYAREEDRRRAAEAGFQTHVAKPVDPSTLIRLVAETVSAARAT